MIRKGARKGVQTRQNIIKKSLQLFSVKGYYNTSINDIMAATHLTKGGLYGHFKSKEEIWYEVYGQAVSVWKDIVFKDIQDLSNPLDRIEKVLDNDLRHYLGAGVFEGGCFFLNMLVELSGQSDVMGSCILNGIMGFSRLLTRWLKEAQEQQMLKPGIDLEEVAQFITVSINGCSALYIANRDPSIWKLTLRQIRQYINGLKSGHP